MDPAGTTYDLLSIMHYSPDAFSKNGRPTIVAKSSNANFGYTEEPTATDLLELNEAYNCKGGTEENENTGTTDYYENENTGTGDYYEGLDPEEFDNGSGFGTIEYTDYYNTYHEYTDVINPTYTVYG